MAAQTQSNSSNNDLGHSTFLENDVPMQGDGYYNSHSALQAAAMHRALSLFDTISVNTTQKSDKFTVAEYGCAQGANSLLPIEHILKLRHSGDDAETVESHLIFSDRPGNDFNTLVQTIEQAEFLKKPTIFTSMVAKSFYERVVPKNSVDVGFSLATLHHLQQSPAFVSTQNDAERSLELNRQQAHQDLVRFLTLRSQELRRGGTLILSFVSRSSTGTLNYPNLIDSCRQALVQMVMDKKITPEAAGAFSVPTYDRTFEDVQKSLAEIKHLWQMDELFEAEITHPAYEQLQKAQASGADPETTSRSYADTVIDWMMAVIAGYFTKALQIAAPQLDGNARQELLTEWINRTKDVFLQKHRDSKVSCWFIFVKLIRL